MKDLLNLTVGRLLVVSKENDFYISSKNQIDYKWKCQCSCGNVKIVRQSKLLSKTRPTLSCGCLRIERLKGLDHPGIKHGKTNTRLYTIWHGIKDRCNNDYKGKNKHYFGKNIKVCKEWSNSFECFYNWSINNGYEEHLTIDRINSNKDYCPENCRWVRMGVQQNNRSNNRLITLWGETKSMSMWLKDNRCKIGRESLKTRLNTGWDIEKAISTPPTRKYISKS